MYYQGMRFRIQRDPGSEGGGGAAPTGGQGAGAAGGAQGSAGAQGGGSAPEYVSKSDFESFSQRFEQAISRFSQPERRSEGEDKGKSGEPKRPNIADYDFKKPGEVDRYEDDKFEYYEFKREQRGEAKRAESEAQDRQRQANFGHMQRMKDYQKANPGAAEALRKAGTIPALAEVKQAVYSSKSSAEIVHYLAQNKDVANELNELAETEGLDAVRERIGELAATIRAERKAEEAAEAAAKDRPPKQNFRGNTGNANRKKSLEERFATFHGNSK